jgi:predicted RNA-binding Zn ribbon-like protein
VSDHRFLLVGGNVVLDFVNTIHDWTAAEPRDYLVDVEDALRFGAAANILSPFEARRLRSIVAMPELRRLREMRARLERILRALIVGRAPLPDDLEALVHEAADAARTATLRRVNDRLERQLDPGSAAGSLLRWRIVEAAIALLLSPDLTRVKTCPSCGWFFLDTSKNGSRRWCSMARCGSSAKARRYYWRSKGQRNLRPPAMRASEMRAP